MGGQWVASCNPGSFGLANGIGMLQKQHITRFSMFDSPPSLDDTVKVLLAYGVGWNP